MNSPGSIPRRRPHKVTIRRDKTSPVLKLRYESVELNPTLSASSRWDNPHFSLNSSSQLPACLRSNCARCSALAWRSSRGVGIHRSFRRPFF